MEEKKKELNMLQSSMSFWKLIQIPAFVFLLKQLAKI